MNMIPSIFRRCYLHLFDTKKELDSTLLDICVDIAVNHKINTTVFSTEFTGEEFANLFIDYYGEKNINKVTEAPLSFTNIKSESFDEISGIIRSCVAIGCKLVILVGDYVRIIDRYNELAEELNISMLAMDINHNI